MGAILVHLSYFSLKELLELAMNSFIEKGESYDEQFGIPATLLPSAEDCVDVSDRCPQVHLLTISLAFLHLLGK